MQRSDQINELAAALAKAQALMKPAPKDSVNPHFKSKYSDLAAVTEAIREPLASNGLALIQLPKTVNGDVVVTTMLTHSSGQFIAEELTMTPQQKTPQGVGSAITYARRYGAMAITGLSSDDDDGEQASAPLPRRPQPAPRYERPEEDVPFEGPPARIGAAPPGPELFAATPRQMTELRRLAKLEGIESNAELAAMAMAFKGYDPKGVKAWPAVEAEHLLSAVKQWASERQKA